MFNLSLQKKKKNSKKGEQKIGIGRDTEELVNK